VQAPPQPAPAPAAVAEVTAAVAAFQLDEPAYHPTVTAFPGFDPETDAAALRKAMKGFGTDEKTIINILSTRTAAQRLRIALTFKTMYGKDLIHDLKKELSGNFEEICIGLLMDNASFDAHCLRKAMKGLGTDEKALIEILCTRTNAEIAKIKEAYTKLFSRDLEHDVTSETSGHFKRILVASLQGNRQEHVPVDLAKAKAEAEELYKAGEKRWGTDESTFNRILCLRSFPQLRATFEEYRKVSEYDIVRTIEHEMSGDLAKAFKAVVQCVKEKPLYFADRLYNAMHGAGTDDETLVRIIVARSEIDMVEIKEAFFDKFNKSLAKMIEGDCSGDYKRMLLALIGEAKK